MSCIIMVNTKLFYKPNVQPNIFKTYGFKTMTHVTRVSWSFFIQMYTVIGDANVMLNTTWTIKYENIFNIEIQESIEFN